MPLLRIHRLVDFEYREVRAWYAGLSRWVADNFTLSFVAALHRVHRHPTAHAPWIAPFRRVRLRRFPYLLLFYADRRVISVLALVHERREPTLTHAALAQRKKAFV